MHRNLCLIGSISLCSILMAGCIHRNYGESAAEATSVKCTDVVYMTDKDFTKPPHPERENLLQKVSEIPEIDFVIQKLGIPKKAAKEWALRGVTGLQGDYCEFSRGDLFNYPANTGWAGQSYFDVASALFKSFDFDQVKHVYNQIHTQPSDPLFDADKHPDVALLTLANITVQKHDPHDYLAQAEGKEKSGQNGWLYPISEQEANWIKESELEGVLEIKDFRTSAGKMMGIDVGLGTEFGPGFYMYYVKSEDLYSHNNGPGYLLQWEADVAAARKVTDDLEYQTRIAKLFRRCIANHTFLDGNGRSCHIWAFHALAERGIPNPLIWGNQDVLVETNEWIHRWNHGIELHKKFVLTLWMRY